MKHFTTDLLPFAALEKSICMIHQDDFRKSLEGRKYSVACNHTSVAKCRMDGNRLIGDQIDNLN